MSVSSTQADGGISHSGPQRARGALAVRRDRAQLPRFTDEPQSRCRDTSRRPAQQPPSAASAQVQTRTQPQRTAPSAPRGRRRDPRRRQAILRAALELVAQVGYDLASIDAIAAKAHVSKPTIYRRWPGKMELIVEAIASRHSEEGDPPDLGSLRQDLIFAIERSRDKLVDDVPLASGIICQMRQSEELCRLIHQEVTAQERQRFLRPLQRAVQRGELPEGFQAPQLFAETAPSLIFTRALITKEDVGQRFVSQLVDQVLLPMLGAAR